MRRHRLMILEMGGYGSTVSDGIAELSPSDDAIEDEKMRVYMLRKARDETIARESIDYLRQALARSRGPGSL